VLDAADRTLVLLALCAAIFAPAADALLVERGLIGWLVKHARRVAPVVEWLAAVQE
jgi:hypothetical protein